MEFNFKTDYEEIALLVIPQCHSVSVHREVLEQNKEDSLNCEQTGLTLPQLL